jgi:esterase/lipase superfamily enzyme
VWYGTNRRPANAANEAAGYSNQRDTVLHYGRAYVHVPKSHVFGTTGSDWWIIRKIYGVGRPLTLERIEYSSAANFFSELRTQLASRAGANDSLVYVHGFNTSFEEAVLRAAQIGFDLKVKGITAAFSWPSAGSITPLSYSADRASIEASEPHLEEFLTRLLTESGSARVHVLAHSMGNIGLLRSLDRVSQTLRNKGLSFGQLILAAPDVDRDLFVRLATVYPTLSARTTLYTSSHDLALQVSSVMGNFARAGFYPPVTVINAIDTVRVSGIDMSIIGHDYYAEAEPVLYDIYALLHNNSDPLTRPRLSAVVENGVRFWDLRP